MIDIVSSDMMKKCDAAECESTSAVILMRRAAIGIYDEMMKVGIAEPVAIVCGTGNNAGDGFALAELMQKDGIACRIFLLTDKLSESGRYYFERAAAAGVGITEPSASGELDLSGFGTVVDCIFGIGFHGEVGQPYRAAIEAINSSGAFIVSADINSGLSADGGVVGGAAVRSDLTISIGSFKPGHFLNSAKDYIKNKVNCDIGIPIPKPTAGLIEVSDIAHLFVREKNDSNKGDFGYVALIGGSTEYSGAAKLANLSLSSLRVGAGVAKLAVPRQLSNAVLPYLLESTLFLLDESDGKYLYSYETTERLIKNTRAVAVGMGMGRSDELKKLLGHLLESYRGRLVIDADGLNELSTLGFLGYKRSRGRVILTPHPKEFERLSGIPIAEMKADPVSAAVDFAKKNGVILLLKGTSTVVTDGEETYIIDRGSVGMSTAGSGDVLSGMLCGICGYARDDELTLAVAAAAYLNGLAGELAEKSIPAVSMLASDTVAHIPSAIRKILSL